MPFNKKLDLKSNDQHILSNGMWADWVRTAKCPCLSESLRPRHDCPVCHGDGYMRVETKRVKGMLTQHRRRGEPTIAGRVEVGDRQFTPGRWCRLSEGDLVIMVRFPLRTSEVIVHDGNPLLGDRVNEISPYKVLAIRSLREYGTTMHVFDPRGYVLEPLTGRIRWTEVSGDPAISSLPILQEQLSVELSYHETYMVWRGEKPMQRTLGEQTLNDRAPVKLVTRRDLMTREF
jgi:hypothetical protein